jgi:hypothetical protein
MGFGSIPIGRVVERRSSSAIIEERAEGPPVAASRGEVEEEEGRDARVSSWPVETAWGGREARAGLGRWLSVREKENERGLDRDRPEKWGWEEEGCCWSWL